MTSNQKLLKLANKFKFLGLNASAYAQRGNSISSPPCLLYQKRHFTMYNVRARRTAVNASSNCRFSQLMQHGTQNSKSSYRKLSQDKRNFYDGDVTNLSDAINQEATGIRRHGATRIKLELMPVTKELRKRISVQRQMVPIEMRRLNSIRLNEVPKKRTTKDKSKRKTNVVQITDWLMRKSYRDKSSDKFKIHNEEDNLNDLTEVDSEKHSKNVNAFKRIDKDKTTNRSTDAENAMQDTNFYKSQLKRAKSLFGLKDKHAAETLKEPVLTDVNKAKDKTRQKTNIAQIKSEHEKRQKPDIKGMFQGKKEKLVMSRDQMQDNTKQLTAAAHKKTARELIDVSQAIAITKTANDNRHRGNETAEKKASTKSQLTAITTIKNAQADDNENVAPSVKSILMNTLRRRRKNKDKSKRTISNQSVRLGDITASTMPAAPIPYSSVKPSGIISNELHKLNDMPEYAYPTTAKCYELTPFAYSHVCDDFTSTQQESKGRNSSEMLQPTSDQYDDLANSKDNDRPISRECRSESAVQLPALYRRSRPKIQESDGLVETEFDDTSHFRHYEMTEIPNSTAVRNPINSTINKPDDLVDSQVDKASTYRDYAAFLSSKIAVEQNSIKSREHESDDFVESNRRSYEMKTESKPTVPTKHECNDFVDTVANESYTYGNDEVKTQSKLPMIPHALKSTMYEFDDFVKPKVDEAHNRRDYDEKNEPKPTSVRRSMKFKMQESNDLGESRVDDASARRDFRRVHSSKRAMDQCPIKSTMYEFDDFVNPKVDEAHNRREYDEKNEPKPTLVRSSMKFTMQESNDLGESKVDEVSACRDYRKVHSSKRAIDQNPIKSTIYESDDFVESKVDEMLSHNDYEEKTESKSTLVRNPVKCLINKFNDLVDREGNEASPCKHYETDNLSKEDVDYNPLKSAVYNSDDFMEPNVKSNKMKTVSKPTADHSLNTTFKFDSPFQSKRCESPIERDFDAPPTCQRTGHRPRTRLEMMKYYDSREEPTSTNTELRKPAYHDTKKFSKTYNIDKLSYDVSVPQVDDELKSEFTESKNLMKRRTQRQTYLKRLSSLETTAKDASNEIPQMTSVDIKTPTQKTIGIAKTPTKYSSKVEKGLHSKNNLKRTQHYSMVATSWYTAKKCMGQQLHGSNISKYRVQKQIFLKRLANLENVPPKRKMATWTQIRGAQFQLPTIRRNANSLRKFRKQLKATDDGN